MADLRQIARAPGAEQVTAYYLTRIGRWDVIDAAKRLVGGLPNARALAGLPALRVIPKRVPMQLWSKSRVIATIRERRRAGESLASSRAPRNLCVAAIRYCGSWRRAIELAGLDPSATRLRRGRTNEQMVETIARLAATHRHLATRAFCALPGVASAVRRFGGLDEALTAAGGQRWPALLRGMSKAKRETLTYPTAKSVRLRLRALQRDGIRTAREAFRKYPGLLEAIRRHFGTWAQAWAAAGLAPIVRVVARWTRETLIAELQRLARRGVPILYAHLEKIGRHDILGAASRLVGGLTQARALARLGPPPKRTWSKNKVIATIRARHRNGETLAWSRVPKPLLSAAADYCGSWNAAIALSNLKSIRSPARAS